MTTTLDTCRKCGHNQPPAKVTYENFPDVKVANHFYKCPKCGFGWSTQDTEYVK